MPELTVGVAGLGAIGAVVAKRLDEGIEGLKLVAVAGRDPAKTAKHVEGFAGRPKILAGPDLAAAASVVVDCAVSATFRDIALPAAETGRTLITVNAAALLDHLDLVDIAKRSGGRIVVPTGALLAFDAVVAAAEGKIERVTMVTRKPPGGLAGAPYLERRHMSLDRLASPLRVFSGSAGEAARAFPANVNVAAALSLAGVGPERTRIEIWADPKVTRNCHRIEIESEAAHFTAEIDNLPSADNPRTGRLTPLSVIAALRRLTATLTIGT